MSNLKLCTAERMTFLHVVSMFVKYKTIHIQVKSMVVSSLTLVIH